MKCISLRVKEKKPISQIFALKKDRQWVSLLVWFFNLLSLFHSWSRFCCHCWRFFSLTLFGFELLCNSYSLVILFNYGCSTIKNLDSINNISFIKTVTSCIVFHQTIFILPLILVNKIGKRCSLMSVADLKIKNLVK